MKRPTQDRLPAVVIQVFGMVIVIAIAVYAIHEKDNGLLYALLGLAAGALGIHGFSEKAAGAVDEALRRSDPQKRDPS